MPLPILSSFLDRLELIADLRKDYHIVRDEIAGDERNHHVRESMEARHQKRELYMTKKERGVRTPEDIEATKIAVNKAMQNLAKNVPHSRTFPILSGVLDKLEMIVEAREKIRTGGKSKPSPQRGQLLKRVMLVLGVNGDSGQNGNTKKTKKLKKKRRGTVDDYHEEDDEDHIRGNTILSDIPEVTEPPTERRPAQPDPAAAAANHLRDARLAIPGGAPAPSTPAVTTPSHQESTTAVSDEPGVPPTHPLQTAFPPEETHPDAAAAETVLQHATLAESGGLPIVSYLEGTVPLHQEEAAAVGDEEHGPPDSQGGGDNNPAQAHGSNTTHGSGEGGEGNGSLAGSTHGSWTSSRSEGEISDLETQMENVQGTRTRERGRERTREGGNGS